MASATVSAGQDHVVQVVEEAAVAVAADREQLPEVQREQQAAA